MSELHKALQGTFITCESKPPYEGTPPEYQVRIRCPTLESAQQVHRALVDAGAAGCPVDNAPRVAYAVNWTEYERGWGSRPDGHTLHATAEIAAEYIRKATAGRGTGPVPDEYSSPGEIFVTEVTPAQHAEILREDTIWGHVRDNLREP